MLSVFRRNTDPVDEQLRDISRQGSHMAFLAHSCAFLLIILFSLGSLVALSGDALAYVAAVGIRPASIPPAISIGVSVFLVVCMDIGMLYAAAQLRVMMSRRAEPAEMMVHKVVLVLVSIIEAGTYVYMAARFDSPATAAAWALVIARAVTAPGISVYLSMARPLPVGPRDILYQVELATGRGVIVDAVTAANDKAAPLSRKMKMYNASAIMPDEERARLRNMIGVLQEDAPALEPEPDPIPPHRPEPGIDDDYTSGEHTPEEYPLVAALRIVPSPNRSKQRARGKMQRDEARQRQAYSLLAGKPDMSARELSAHLGCRWDAAKRLKVTWEHSQRGTAAL